MHFALQKSSYCISIWISLKYFLKGLNDNKPALVQVINGLALVKQPAYLNRWWQTSVMTYGICQNELKYVIFAIEIKFDIMFWELRSTL